MREESFEGEGLKVRGERERSVSDPGQRHAVTDGGIQKKNRHPGRLSVVITSNDRGGGGGRGEGGGVS